MGAVPWPSGGARRPAPADSLAGPQGMGEAPAPGGAEPRPEPSQGILVGKGDSPQSGPPFMVRVLYPAMNINGRACRALTRRRSHERFAGPARSARVHAGDGG